MYHRDNKVFNVYKSLHSMIQLQKSKVVLRDEEICIILNMYTVPALYKYTALYYIEHYYNLLSLMIKLLQCI